MEADKTTPAGRGAITYSKRLPFYDNEEGMALLQQLAQQRGVRAAALLRMLVREEARRAGVLPSATTAPQRSAVNGQLTHAPVAERQGNEAEPVSVPEATERPTRSNERSNGHPLSGPRREAMPDRTAELFDLWAEEDETEDAAELARRGSDWETLKASLNANRAAAGEEPLF